jgi:hypothetical protein
MGEGGSRRALAIGVGDELAMLSTPCTQSFHRAVLPRCLKDPSREREAADTSDQAEIWWILASVMPSLRNRAKGPYKLAQTAANLAPVPGGALPPMVKDREQRRTTATPSTADWQLYGAV